MNRLWAPWRIEYIRRKDTDGCVFCQKSNSNDDKDDLVKRMEENDVPAAKINKREEIFSDPQVINNNSVINTKKNGEDLLKGPKPPANFLDNQCEEPKFMPALGQHSSEILQEYGFSNDEINELIDSEVIQGDKVG